MLKKQYQLFQLQWNVGLHVLKESDNSGILFYSVFPKCYWFPMIHEKHCKVMNWLIKKKKKSCKGDI